MAEIKKLLSLALLVILGVNSKSIPLKRPHTFLESFVDSMKFASAACEDSITWLKKLGNKFGGYLQPPTLSSLTDPGRMERQEDLAEDDISAIERYQRHMRKKVLANLQRPSYLENSIAIHQRLLQQDGGSEAGNNGGETVEEEDDDERQISQKLNGYSDERSIYISLPSLSDTTTSFRMPQGSKCQHGGYKASVALNTWACSRDLVTKAEYDQMGQESREDQNLRCVSKSSSIEVCYCPKDFFGRYCESPVGITCSNFRTTPMSEACETAYNTTSRNKMGFAPCRLWNGSQYEFKVQTRGEVQQEMVEGVKLGLVLVVFPALNNEANNPVIDQIQNDNQDPSDGTNYTPIC